MPEITSNVAFEHIAREWRCKWSPDNDKASLSALSALLSEHLEQIKATGAEVQRVVCGGCMDFKVVMKLPAADYEAWSGADHAPEAAFLEAMRAIPDVTAVETQTYTLETL